MLDKKQIIVLVALNIVFIVIPLVFPCVHFTLDNDLMQFFSSGVYTGKPSEYTIYTNILHGLLLKMLYTFNSHVAWYAVYEYFCNLMCTNIFIYLLLQWKFNKIIKSLACILVSIVCFIIAIQPDYTIVAGELGLASIALYSTSDSVIAKKNLVFSIVLFFMGAILRIQAVVIPYCVFLPLLICIFLKHKKMMFIYNALLILILIFLFSFNSWYYNRSNDWKKYCEYNALRMKINDNPSASDCVNLYANKDEKSELVLLNEYRVNDGTILNARNLKISTDFLSHRYFYNIAQNIKPYYYTYAYMLRIIIGFVLLAVVCMFAIRDRKGIILVLASFVMFLLANFYTMSISRPKEPVMLILTASLIACCSILIHNKIKKSYLLTLMAFLLSGGAYLKLKDAQYAIKQNKTYIKQSEICQALCAKIDDSKILFHNATYCRMNVWTECNSLVGKKFVRVGWTVNSPHTKKYYQGYKSYVDNNLPMMINSDYEQYLDMIEKSLKSYYKTPVKRRILVKQDKMQIIKFEKI